MNEIKLCEFLYKIDRPILFKNSLVFDNQSNKNSAILWTPESLRNVFEKKKLEFRVGNRNSCNLLFFFHWFEISLIFELLFHPVQFENECVYISATIDEFNEWIISILSN